VRIKLLEHSCIIEGFLRQSEIVVADHVKLSFQLLRLHAHHACLVALIDDSDQEIHQDYISAEHQEHINNPSHDLVLRILYVERTFSPHDAERHDDVADRPQTLTIGTGFIENDHH
jgi:hypothetical protein